MNTSSLATHAAASNTKSEATSSKDEEKLIWLKTVRQQ